MTVSYFDGFDMGLATVLLGQILDNTIGLDSKLRFASQERNLYVECYRAVNINLLIVGPIFFALAKQLSLLDLHSNTISPLEYLPLIFIHNVGYHFMHYLMHKNNYMRKWHNFHHQFIKPIFPSVGNAVSFEEFTFAYVMPFILGAAIVSPNVQNFKMAIGVISLLNLTIHTEELRNIKYPEYIVSPYKHTEHHHKTSSGENDTYSAPLIDLDYFSKLIKKSSNSD